jgi:hypothetical protein
MKYSVLFLLISLLTAASSSAAETETAPPAPEESSGEAVEKPDADAWREDIAETRQRMQAFNLISRLSTSGGAKVSIPSQYQRLPLEEMEDTKKLAGKGLEVYLRELRLYNVRLDNPGDTKWAESHPYLPTTIYFDRIQVSADAKTKFANFPLKSQFLDGKLPVNFDILRKAYEVNVMPEAREKEGRIGNVKIESGIPFASGILTRQLGPKLQQSLIEFGIGQTLKLNMDGGMDLQSLVQKGIYSVITGELEEDDDLKPLLEDDKLKNVLDGLFR